MTLEDLKAELDEAQAEYEELDNKYNETLVLFSKLEYDKRRAMKRYYASRYNYNTALGSQENT
jgi:predicted nuclease with TOPRIM domain